MESSKRIKEFCNKQFYQVINNQERILIFQGGARSGKTYSICQALIYKMINVKEPLTITIIRNTLPSLKRSVLRDFLSILDKLGLYDICVHNKSENTIKFQNKIIQMISADEPMKLRGASHDIVFMNEANECNYETFRQVNMRCRKQLILDFNPSEPVSWLYTELIDKDDPDVKTFISTWRDNKFLPESVIKEIEKLKERDLDYYNVFGLGQRAVFSQRQIYTNWKYIDYKDFPDIEYFIGLDFGFSVDNLGMCLVGRHKDSIYIHELLYRKAMTNQDIVNYINEKNLEGLQIIYDSAEPKSGEELRRAGLIVKPSTKGAGSVNAGISKIKEFKVYVSKESTNIFKEQQSYLWDELKDGTIINKPIQNVPEHLLDAIRYVVYTKFRFSDNFFVI
ncbi:MAG: putative terminase large subunit [Prokaryotic dsDNA virus sp.]|nr:MAG: putative terminase large subunit [Prokaryotic dsDNA virus sp.]|tara:strand:- start:1673 stop:2854 length:1182 start_codon:yes stop_codon:yes gene_type:complete